MQINFEPIENAAEATAEMFNSRFAQLVDLVNGNIDTDNIKNGAVTKAKLAADVMTSFYPIGSLYFNATDDTNPGTLLGFGTWEAYAAGRVPVGFDSTQTEFNAAEKTGGHKSLQAHTHSVNPPNATTSAGGNHAHSYTAPSSPITVKGINPSDTALGHVPGHTGGTTSTAGNHTHTLNIGSFTSGSTGTGNAGNLQPFVTEYIWKLTA